MGVEDQFMTMFNVDEDENRVQRWEEWVSRLERLMSIKDIVDDKQRQNYLFFFGGSELEKIYKKSANERDSYENIKQKIGDHFKSKYNPKLNVLHFRDLCQHDGEPFEDFVNRLKEKAKLCSFKDENQEIALQIVHRCKSTSLKRRALEAEKELTLEDLIKYGKLEESVDLQMKEFKKFKEEVDNLEINRLQKPGRSGFSKYDKNDWQSNGSRSKDVKSGGKTNDLKTKKTCFNCGNEYPHEKVCPAKGKKCLKCEGYDHFAKCCKQSCGKKRQVKKIKEESDFGEDSSYGNIWRVRLRNNIMSVKDWLMPMVVLWLSGISLGFGVDTGAHVNIMDEGSFNKLRFRPRLHKARSRLYAYGQESCIDTIGSFKTRVKYKGQNRSVEFVVTKGNFGNLLSYKTCVDLGIMVKINSVNNNKAKDTFKEKLIKRFPSLFSGKIGLLNGHQVDLYIDESVKPIQQKLRPVPFHMRGLVEKEIMEMLEQEIIEPVNGPTPWVSPIVAVPKPGRPNEVRICTDAREMNKAIRRTRHAFPTIEDLVVKLNGAKFISKFDLKSGYMQLLLAEKCRYITAFCTHMGIFQYKRLNFGINAASEIFQRVIEQVLPGIDGVMNFSDDIIVYAATKAEHDTILEAVLKRLNESGLTVNESKCEFGKQSLNFFGLNFSSNGISIDEKKCDALLNAKAPNTVGEVRSLLGLANYCSRFIPNYASTIEPLRHLIKKGTKWSWDHIHDEALAKMKKSLCTDALSYFDPKLRTEITVDASPVGVAAVLSQYDPKLPQEKRIVMYASRSLTKVEQRYSQVEREALAFVWACEKFHIYIYAKEFDVITDNKAVELIFGNVRSKPKARIERWCLRLLPYKYVVKHKSGAYNIADYMSRNPIGPADRSNEKFTESYINLIAQSSLPKAISKKELVKATKEDEDLKEVVKLIDGSNLRRILSYEKVIDELSITKDGLIMKGTRLIIPKSLQNRIIGIAHSGHLGIVKTKQLLRSHVWFPGMDALVEKTIKRCHKCQINTDSTKFEPSCPTEMPEGPWSLISIDFYGPLRCGKYLLVIICEYSRYPLVKTISSTSAGCVIPVLNEIFSIFGIPHIVKSDNGPPFNSFNFKQFTVQQGFKHRKITPLWPRSNGMCERFMRNLGKVMRNSGTSQSEWESELIEFLRNYRDTPHSSTGVSPNMLMFQHSLMTSKLPNVSNPQVFSNKKELHLKARNQDFISKSKMKTYNDKKLKAKTSNFKCGDVVLLKWRRSRKSDSLFDPNPFKIVKINGSMITVERNGSVLVRNSSFMKLYIQDECERGSRIVKDIMFGEDKNVKPEPEIIDDDRTIKSGITNSDVQSSAVGTDGFETGDEYELRLEEEENEKDGNLEDQDSEGERLEDNEEKVDEQRPKRVTKKPDRFGNPVEHGTRSYTKKTN